MPLSGWLAIAVIVLLLVIAWLVDRPSSKALIPYVGGPLRPRFSPAEIQAALAQQANGTLPTINTAIDAIRAEFALAVSAHDSINGRAGALPPIVVAISVISFSDIPTGNGYLIALGALVTAVTAASFATLFAFIALRAGRFDVGPDPIKVAQVVRWRERRYKQALLNSLAQVTQHALDSTQVKSWWFNMALAAGLVSVLAAFVLSLVGGGGS